MSKQPARAPDVTERAMQYVRKKTPSGFEEALSRMEDEREERVVPDEDAAQKLSMRLARLQPGQRVRLVYYANGRYIPRTGTVTKLAFVHRYLDLDDTRIGFEDILEIKT